MAIEYFTDLARGDLGESICMTPHIAGLVEYRYNLAILDRYTFQVTSAAGDRSKHFPAIEKKHGQSVKFFLSQLKDLGDAKYPEQIAYLKENHGFSQTHANALVMYSRGSKSSKRHASTSEYFETVDPKAAKKAKEIFKIIQSKYPNLELVVSWNQPMLRNEKGYVFGLGVQKNHILINPFSKTALENQLSKTKSLKVNKHTIQIPFDWEVNAALLIGLVRERLKELT